MRRDPAVISRESTIFIHCLHVQRMSKARGIPQNDASSLQALLIKLGYQASAAALIVPRIPSAVILVWCLMNFDDRSPSIKEPIFKHVPKNC